MRKPSGLAFLVTICVSLMLMIAVACAGGDEEATTAPAATAVPEVVATAVPEVVSDADKTHIERYLDSPGYDPDWGQPKTGGTFVFGSNRDTTKFNPSTIGGCYAHGCWSELAYNSLFRIDPWVGDIEALEGDVAESWAMSGDGKTLEVTIREGVTFYTNPHLPAEVADKVNGDSFTCEDAVATFDRMAKPPKHEEPLMRTTRAMIPHYDSTTCPDGEKGLTFVLHFDPPKARTMSSLGRGLAMLDKDWIEWLHGHEENIMNTDVPNNFLWQSGTGAFVPDSINVGTNANWVKNENYWRDGLPLLDKYENVVLRDATARFTALATGNIHFYGEGSYGFTSGQAEQAMRDFPEEIKINPQKNMWARVLYFNSAKPPFDDWRVREAVHLALDREEWRMFRQVVAGTSVIEGTNMAYSMPPNTYFSATDEEISNWAGWKQPKDDDIAEANRLLDEVWGEGVREPIQCLAPATQVSDVDGCLFVIDQLKKHLNWEVASDFLDTTPVYDKRSQNNYTLTVGSGSVSTITGDPDDEYMRAYHRDFTPTTYGDREAVLALHKENPEGMQKLEDMINAQSAEMDKAKRRTMVREMEDYLRTEIHGWHTMLGWTNIFPSWRTEVKGYQGYDLFSFTKGAMWERVWLGE